MRILLAVLLLGVTCQGKTGKEFLDSLRQHIIKKQVTEPTPNPYSPGWNNGPDYATPNWSNNGPTSPPETYYPTEDELVSLHEAFMFPGSSYLTDMIKNYVEYGMNEEMNVDDIRDWFEVPQCDMEDVSKELFKVSRVIKDPEFLALYATRMFIKPVLKERMKCPAAILDVAIAKTLFGLRHKFLSDEDESWYTMIRNAVPLIDPMLEPYTEDIAQMGVHELHGFLFNETLELIFGFGLRDVALASHRMYENFVYFFSPDSMYMYPTHDRKYMFTDSVHSALWEVVCPSHYNILENHRKIIMRFRNEFQMIERERICMGVTHFLHKYVNMTMPWHLPDFENSVGLQLVCDEIAGSVGEVLERYSDYESVLYSMNISELDDLLKEYLPPHEWDMLEEALRRLGFFDESNHP